MKVLVLGGTGMIGSHLTRHLVGIGYEVVVGARRRGTTSAVSGVPLILGDYTRRGFGPAQLEGFDAVVLAAANDIRHLPAGADVDRFWQETQIEGVPRLVADAKRAGVRRLVQIGSYYHQVMPELAVGNAYVRARQLADEGARALADAAFNVSTLNPPSVVGAIHGPNLVRFQTMVAWARGEMPHIPSSAPAGGTNYISARSLAEAVAGALKNAVSGHAYLVGDQNLSFAEFFQLFVDAAGGSMQVAERDIEHALLPDAFIVPGRGTRISYEPDAVEVERLGYSRGDVRRAVEEIVGMVDRTLAERRAADQ